MRFLRRSLVGLLLLSLTVGLLAFAGQSVREALQSRWAEESRPRPSRERVFAVNVLEYAPSMVTPQMTSFGEVRSRRTLELRATSSGSIVHLAESFVEGGQVRAGELLLRIDPADADSALAVAQTDLAEAAAEQVEAAAALELARDDVASARGQLDLRSQALERQENLFTRGVGTEAAVESAALAEAAAKQAVLSRRQALAQATARISQADTALARRQIALAEAERRLADTEIFAGFAGTLSDVAVVQGGLVQNNEHLALLVDPTALEVAFRVSTAEYARLLDDDGKLRPADVTVTLDIAGVDLVTKGRISRESASVGEGQTGRQLFARVDRAQGFRPGDFVSLSVQEPALRRVALLPATAVDAAETVLVVGEEDRLQVKPVTVLRRQGDDVIVRGEGLRGAEIVSERSPLLGAGIKVRPIRSGAESAPEAPEMVELSAERRARLVAFIEANNRMPAEAKKRVLAQLSQPQVPAQVVQRIEARMGG